MGLLPKLIGFSLLLASTTFAVFNANYFKVQKVETIWDREEFFDPLVPKFLEKQFLQKNIFLLLPNQELLHQNLPDSIKKVAIKKVLPQTLLINLETRRPVLLLSAQSTDLKIASVSAVVNDDILNQNNIGTPSFWVDESGFTFNQKISSLSSLPKALLSREDLQSPPRPLSSQFFFRFFLEYRQRVSSGGSPTLLMLLLTTEGETVARLGSGTYLILPKEGIAEDQVASLNLILNKYAIEGRNLKKVDLRFKNPVVEFR